MKRSQRGFSLLETVIAAAVVTVIGVLILTSAAQVLRWNALFAQQRTAETAIESLADRLEAEEDSAWAIFTPPLDAYGSSNADGHEVDFFFRDAQNRAHFIAYCYDKANRRIQRLLYAKPGGMPVADGAPVSGVGGFFARTYPVTALQDPGSLVYTELYRSAELHAAEVHFDRTQPWLAGGNQITYVRLTSAHVARELQLSTQTAPSGFTIVLRYTPAPSASPPQGRLTAAIVTAQVIGHWEDCPSHSECSNAEWPKYVWRQTTTSQYYESYDGGYSWALFDTEQGDDSGTSGPTGGDVPPPCQAVPGAVYMRVCSPDWTPSAPPGTAGMKTAP
ncbi:MAG TPA: type II secretion system protein [Candidatus Rubrimentiphilum sp.]|nr:type II secretion system protein [Candidatus Rubrimentiphilum sp.]